MPINIIILAAGTPSHSALKLDYPICLTELNGSSILERIVYNSRNIEDSTYTFAIRKPDIKRFHLDKVARLLVPKAFICSVPDGTQGSACTALLATCGLHSEYELLIISTNELVDLDMSLPVKDFRNRNLDAGTLTFKSVHPRYSYVKINSSNQIIQAAQREPISQHATVGIFWFRNTKSFIDASQCMIRKNVTIDEMFYIAPTLNELILAQKQLGSYPIDVAKYFPLKTEQQANQFEQG